MAGTAPPKDAPPVAEQDVVTADVGFPPSPTATDICGLAFPPTFSFSISLNIPFPNFKLPLPFNFALSLTCDLENPVDAEVSFGGGRKSTGDFTGEDRDF
jgi:hypothetical protein